MTLETLDYMGELTISFSEEMKEIKQLDLIDGNVIRFQIETPEQEYIDYRSYDWYLSSYNATNCSFQFNWEHPPWISSASTRDKLVLKVLSPKTFLNPKKRALKSNKIEENSIFRFSDGSWEIKIPPQIYPDQV